MASFSLEIRCSCCWHTALIQATWPKVLYLSKLPRRSTIVTNISFLAKVCCVMKKMVLSAISCFPYRAWRVFLNWSISLGSFPLTTMQTENHIQVSSPPEVYLWNVTGEKCCPYHLNAKTSQGRHLVDSSRFVSLPTEHCLLSSIVPPRSGGVDSWREVLSMSQWTEYFWGCFKRVWHLCLQIPGWPVRGTREECTKHQECSFLLLSSISPVNPWQIERRGTEKSKSNN